VDHPVESAAWLTDGSGPAVPEEGTNGDRVADEPASQALRKGFRRDGPRGSARGEAWQEGPYGGSTVSKSGISAAPGGTASEEPGEAVFTPSQTETTRVGPAFIPDQPATATETENSGRTFSPYGALAKARAASRKTPVSGRRRANLTLTRLEPWSVMKFSFLMSLVAWLVLFVAVAVLYYALAAVGVFTAIEHTVSNVTSSKGSTGTSISHWLSASRVLGYTMLLGAVNVVLITALATIGSMIYNIVTKLGGGIEVTLEESE